MGTPKSCILITRISWSQKLLSCKRLWWSIGWNCMVFKIWFSCWIYWGHVGLSLVIGPGWHICHPSLWIPMAAICFHRQGSLTMGPLLLLKDSRDNWTTGLCVAIKFSTLRSGWSSARWQGIINMLEEWARQCGRPHCGGSMTSLLFQVGETSLFVQIHSHMQIQLG